jgi:hypothetical protein
VIAVVAAAAILAAVRPAAAQEKGWGILLGASATNLYGDYVTVRGETQWGFVGGMYAERRLAGNLAVNIGANYTQRGGKGLTGSVPDTYSYDVDVNYIELPLLLEILLPLSGTWDLIAYGGIGASFNVACNATIGDAAKTKCKDTELGKAQTEWELPVGGGFSYEVGNGEMVVFEARYIWGLSDVVADQNLRNRGWQFLLRLAKGL